MLDLFTGYYQVLMADSDINKTAFICREGTYQWTVMPFSLARASGTFQHMMEEILHKVLKAQAYLDDILFGTATFEELLVILRRVLACLKSHNLHLSRKKCVVFMQ